MEIKWTWLLVGLFVALTPVKADSITYETVFAASPLTNGGEYVVSTFILPSNQNFDWEIAFDLSTQPIALGVTPEMLTLSVSPGAFIESQYGPIPVIYSPVDQADIASVEALFPPDPPATETPEPSSLMLLGSALIATGWYRKRLAR